MISSRVDKAKELLKLAAKKESKKIPKEPPKKIKHTSKQVNKQNSKKPKKKMKEKKTLSLSNPPQLSNEQIEITTKLLDIIRKNINDADFRNGGYYTYIEFKLSNVDISMTCISSKLKEKESDAINSIYVRQYRKGFLMRRLENKLEWSRNKEGNIFRTFWEQVTNIVILRYEQLQIQKRQLNESNQRNKLQSIISNLKE